MKVMNELVGKTMYRGSRTDVRSHLAKIALKKRVFDTLTLIVAAPIVVPVGLAVAAAVRSIDGKPVLFQQERTGLNHETFAVTKFRTMRRGDGRNEDSTRITPLGRFLRKTSLDELPQLWNVLKGEMSLVGPRPLYPEYVPYYTEEEQLRHAVRPGITGLSQISGRNALRWSSRLAKDVEYVRTASITKDITIMAKTIRKALAGDDVAAVARDTGEPLNIERSYPRESRFALRRFNLLDVPYRVEWMNDARTRRYMQIPFVATTETTTDWYHQAKQDPLRDDFVIYERSNEVPVAMVGLKSGEGSNSGILYTFVDPDRCGEGIGTASLKLLLEWAKSSRYDTVMLSVEHDNTPAWTLYEKLGFIRGVDEEDNRRTYEFSVSNKEGAHSWNGM